MIGFESAYDLSLALYVNTIYIDKLTLYRISKAFCTSVLRGELDCVLLTGSEIGI